MRVTPSAAPGTKTAAVTEIERLGFKFEEVADYDLTQLSPERRVQVRETMHYAPKDAVEKYAIMMGETSFPPVIVTRDAWIVDGNTRVGAKLKRKEKFFPALVLDVSWDGGTEKQKDDLLILAATLNSMHGLPLTPKEVRQVTAIFIERGFKSEQIARAIGLKPSSIAAVKKEIDAAKKLDRVGLGSNGELRGASLRALGAKNVLVLNDVPFKELAQLAADAGLNSGEIVSVAKAAKETGSDSEQVEVIQAERLELGDRIREHSLTGSGKPPVSRQLRQHLGFVTKFSGREQELIETDPKVTATHAEAVRNAVNVLNVLLEAQGGDA
jgi:hypothetical protein